MIDLTNWLPNHINPRIKKKTKKSWNRREVHFLQKKVFGTTICKKQSALKKSDIRVFVLRRLRQLKKEAKVKPYPVWKLMASSSKSENDKLKTLATSY